MTTKRTAYELLSSKTTNAIEQHYSTSEIEIMDPDTYGGSISSANPTSIHTIQSETRSSSRRQHHHKKRQHDDNPSSAILTSGDSQDERIEVKILPQDDNWGETTTTTCNGMNEDTLTNTNDTSLQLGDQQTHQHEHLQFLTKRSSRQKFSSTISQFATYFLCLIAFISPIFFLTIPYALVSTDFIHIHDYTDLVTIIFKLIFLILTSFFLLYRRRNTLYLPSIHIQKTLLLSLVFLLLIVYWFYYIFQLINPKIESYQRILSFTSSYEDLLLYILIISILILEIKWLYPKYIVKVVRSPDGQIRQYTIGSMSIQEASVYLLEQYYKDFPVFNPWLENAQQAQGKRHGGYSTKSVGSQSNSSTIVGGTSTRSARGFNDRFYDELDYERRVRKRRTKLLSSCEDAFTHVRKCLNEKYGTHIPMDAREAAQAVFSSMARSLQKYLRLTRQQPYFTRESIISHLAICLSHDLSPRTFLERYIQTESQPLATLLFPVLSTVTNNSEQSWTITSHPSNQMNSDDKSEESICLNQTIYSNLTVVLKQQHAEHIALICTFYSIPRVNLIEKFFDSKQNKFVLKLNSETSV